MPSPALPDPAGPPAARLARARGILLDEGRDLGLAQRVLGDDAVTPTAKTPSGSPQSEAPSEPGEDAAAEATPERASRTSALAFAVMSGAVKPLVQPETAAQARRLGVRLFPTRTGDDPSRMELAALATALVGAAFVGSTIPGGAPVQAAGGPVAPLLLASAPVTATPAPAATPASDDADSTSSDSSADVASVAGATGSATAPADSEAAPAGSDASEAADTADTADESSGDPGDGSDPLGGGGGTNLSRVALIVARGTAPAKWATAESGSPARARAALGTTFTGLAVLPGAPLSAGLAYVAGQPSNPVLRQGCTTAQPLTPGAVDAAGVARGTGCDYPAEVPSLPGAVARDGRTWRAYTLAVTPAEAAARLCSPYGSAGGAAPSPAAQESPLGHLADLTTSGACDGAAAPLSQLADDLKSDSPPAWIYIEVGDCDPTGCTAAADAAREAALDDALKTLAAVAPPEDGKSAAIVVGDGTAAEPQPAEAGAYPTSPDDPTAPAAIASGALLVGDDVEADAIDPLALDPFAIARTQAAWLGLTPPGLAAADSTTSLRLPGA